MILCCQKRVKCPYSIIFRWYVKIFGTFCGVLTRSVPLVDDKRLNWHGLGHSSHCILSSSYPFRILLLLSMICIGGHSSALCIVKAYPYLQNKVILSHISLLCVHSILTLGLFLKEATRYSNVPTYYKLSQ